MKSKVKQQAKAFLQKFVSDQRGQGMAEYILLLVIVVGVVMVFKGPFIQAFQTQITAVTSSISGFTAQ